MLQMTILLASLTVICGGAWAMPARVRSAEPTVTLDSATVTGISSGSVNKFLGIPYAQPPLNNLRFEPPQPLQPYDSDFSATDSGPVCPQRTDETNWDGPAKTEVINLLSKTDDVICSEDCLTLDVVTPASAVPASGLPVAVWIHGGAFETGGKSESLFNGSVIVERSISLGVPIVYVAINYRLNIFGFLGGKEVQDAGVGNLGLRDQRLALKWVQEYISAFGGDPTKVTIWGESAGSISVGFQMLAGGGDPGGLFRAAFMESGSPINSGDMSTVQSNYDALVELANCTESSDTLDCLRYAPYQTLVDALNTSPYLTSNGDLQSPFCPRIDGVFVTANPYDLVRQGSVANVPFVIGDCDDEGTLFSTRTSSGISTDAEFGEFVKTAWMANSPLDLLSQVMEMYPSDPSQGSPFDTGDNNVLTAQYKRIAAFQGDLVFQAPRRFFLQSLSGRQNAWTFLSTRNKNTPILGAAHTSDLYNVFGGGDLTSYLVRFVANLDPNVGQREEIYWPQYNVSDRIMLEFPDGSNVEYKPRSGRRGYNPAQSPIQIHAEDLTQTLITDTYRSQQMELLFQIAEENPF